MKRTLTAAIAAFLLLFSLCMTAHAEPTPDPNENPTGGTATNPFTPSGAGTVVDFATGEDGKIFYTIVAPDESVFYLVIDKQRNAENVYFLNAVTVDDLLSLAANPSPKPGAAVVPTTPPPTENTPTEPTTEPKPEQGGNNTGMLIIVLVLAALGGGAAWYFKIYKPKQQGAGADEYEPPVEEETDFDDWDDTDEDGGDTDAPPWEVDGDEESGAADE